jgi:hypothetical protein
VEGMAREKGAGLPQGVKRGVKASGLEAQQWAPTSASEVASERR